MAVTKVKIKIYSDRRDISLITSSVRQIEIKDVVISYSFPRKLEINPEEILILQIDDIRSGLLGKLVEIKEDIKNKILIVVRDDNALLISSLVKMGFYDIFLFPHELFRFTSFLTEVITNKLYLVPASISSSHELDIYDFDSITGESPEILKIIEIAKKVSENNKISVLILGETGTGKGLLARAIHKNSKSANFPFVEIVCSAIPENLLESELFGYEKGAFTNALNKKLGLFELAEKGTVFLDEVGDLSFNLQVKLLRIIEKKVIRRVGGIEDIPVNSRIISATNRNLQEMVDKNLFRRDLFHRLNVVSIILPPLRDRGNDVILLAKKFIKEFNKLFNKSINKLDKDLEEFMINYSWPGNIRELRNAIERAVLLSEDKTLKLHDFANLLKNLPLNILEKDEHVSFHPNLIRLDLDFKQTSLKRLTELYAREVIKKMKGNKSKSAKILDISRPKLDKLL
jgi:two-component system, NtrC family, response regulator AtoC